MTNRQLIAFEDHVRLLGRKRGPFGTAGQMPNTKLCACQHPRSWHRRSGQTWKRCGLCACGGYSEGAA